jgi:hypothetical protein
VDVGAAAWRSERRRDFPGPGGTDGSEFTMDSGRSAGASVLGRAEAGRVAAIAGAGPALFWRGTSTRTILDGAERSNTRFRGTTLGLRFLLELEAELTNRVSAFAGARAELFDLRGGIGTGALSSGLRVQF